MKTEPNYTSFNNNKSIEELRYILSNHISNLEYIKVELEFYDSLLDKTIFRPQVRNLFEKLDGFKKEINLLVEKHMSFLNNQLYSHLNSVKNKIECDDVACDNFFISEHDALDLEVFNFYKQVNDLKSRLFPFFLSVIND
jgi:division protein CdvB (Snf7/Vps24/ESCRT-III family)